MVSEFVLVDAMLVNVTILAALVTLSISGVLPKSSRKWKTEKPPHIFSAHIPVLHVSTKKNVCGVEINGITVIKT